MWDVRLIILSSVNDTATAVHHSRLRDRLLFYLRRQQGKYNGFDFSTEGLSKVPDLFICDSYTLTLCFSTLVHAVLTW